MLKSLLSMSLVTAMAACGPAGRDKAHGGDDDGTGVDAPEGTCVPSAEVCNDGIDNDCNGRIDCGDIACSGVGGCPVCGVVENPEATPLALPDGVSSGTTCSVDADCAATPGTPNCIVAGSTGSIIKECHASYTSTLDFIGFPAGSTLTDTSKLLKVCVKMEHSWMRDLHIELITPPDSMSVRRKIPLHKFIDRTGGETYLGEANDADDAANPVAGVGYTYCWTAAAPNQMISAPTVMWQSHEQLPAGDYAPAVPFTALQGTPLNGTWQMRVTDLWGIDNGFMFEWSIAFDPSLVSDCSGPIIQ